MNVIAVARFMQWQSQIYNSDSCQADQDPMQTLLFGQLILHFCLGTPDVPVRPPNAGPPAAGPPSGMSLSNSSQHELYTQMRLAGLHEA